MVWLCQPSESPYGSDHFRLLDLGLVTGGGSHSPASLHARAPIEACASWSTLGIESDVVCGNGWMYCWDDMTGTSWLGDR